ncbi:MAG: caspase family protein [Comamonadaceae bacterium]|nr:caspase family protein [Comamonadaceae bacterium]
MKTITPITLRALALATLFTGFLGIGGQVQAANHALIMTINYSGTRVALPGIDKDGEFAVKIAQGMGVPRQNIKWLRNRELSMGGMSAAIEDLTQNRIADGDKVFMYYSGHGYQTSGADSKCSESLVTADFKFFQDERLRQSLDNLAAKASQVVMFNDSCFSGGAATKDITRSDEDAVPKLFVDDKSASAADANYTCGQAINKDFGARTLGVVALQRPIQMLYVAASSDNEVSRASRTGSWATQAWAACLSGRGADSDGNGIVDGNELRQCAQSFIGRRFPSPKPSPWSATPRSP